MPQIHTPTVLLMHLIDSLARNTALTLMMSAALLLAGCRAPSDERKTGVFTPAVEGWNEYRLAKMFVSSGWQVQWDKDLMLRMGPPTAPGAASVTLHVVYGPGMPRSYKTALSGADFSLDQGYVLWADTRTVGSMPSMFTEWGRSEVREYSLPAERQVGGDRIWRRVVYFRVLEYGVFVAVSATSRDALEERWKVVQKHIETVVKEWTNE